MSLVSFIRLDDVAERLKPFRPPVRAVHARVKVPSVSGNPQLVGTAFDYLLRFELQRRAPDAVTRTWIAEHVPQLLNELAVEEPWAGWDDESVPSADKDVSLTKVAKRVKTVCRKALRALGEYLHESEPSDESQRVLAGWAVRLAKIDGVYRAGALDLTFEDAPADLVSELVDLLAVVPFEQLVHPEVMLLNPDFGPSSDLVGGADADLITGDMLVDFKTTKSAEVRGETLDQLFGYFLLARRAGLPPIQRVGVYFSRHAQLRTGETAFWTSRPDFAETERWFFERARESFSPCGL